MINTIENLRDSACAKIRMHARSKYKRISDHLTLVILRSDDGRNRDSGEKARERDQDGMGARARIRDDPARNEGKLAARNGTSKYRMTLVIERAIYLPHRPPTVSFIKPLTNSTLTIYYASKFS